MILCVVGPTGVGKTKLSVMLAKRYDAIIINADAMQIYKGMDIGTAKIKEEEKEGIKHFLFDVADVNYNYTVFDYQKDARKILEENKDKNIIFVGGTGLYLKAALYSYKFNTEDKTVNLYDGLTDEEVYELAKKKDKNVEIHKNNRRRLIRFLNKDSDVVPLEEIYKATYIGLTTSRENLYNRINDRVDKMINDGLLREVKSFYDKKVYSKAINTAIGYKELYKYFDGEISLEEATDLIKKNSRHYAKRQYTWFNHQLPVIWFDVNFDDFNKTYEEVVERIENGN